MSHSKDNLVLHLKLDEIIEEGDERKVSDALTGSKYNVKGNPEIVIDDKLGGCLSFDGEGDYVELIEADKLGLQNSSFTVEAWINIEDLSIDNQSILGNDEQLSEKSLHLIIRQKKPYLGFFNNDTPGNTELSDNNWYHITWRYDKNNQEQAIFVNGVLDNSSTGHAPFQGNGIVRIGRWVSRLYLKGKIAHVRIYNRALFSEEIKQDMDDDLKAIASFNKTYPLDFNLYEGEDKESVIFIENGTRGQELVLEIVNSSDRPISFPAKSGAVSKANHHFELRFRPDTLSPDSRKQLVLAEKEGWSMISPVTQADDITQTDGIVVSLYFLATNNQALKAKETIAFTLQHINGAAAGGARTTRVELKCPQFTYHGGTVTDYYREKRLSIISHRGKKHIPLHVGFVGSNRILNDGSSKNELILRITNKSKDESISFKPASKGNAPSKLIISFDIDNDWALGTKSEVESIGVQYEGKEIEGSDQGESPEWIIDFDKETAIEAGQHHELVLSGIISSRPSGHTNLYLRYENIPGYWDGTFVCTIEKSPILYNKYGNVGIGTTDPSAPLQVEATNKTRPDMNGLYIFNSTNEANQNANLCLRVAGTDGGYPFVSWDIFGETGWSMGIDNSDGNKLKIANSWSSLTTRTFMTLDTNGNVGIGTPNPSQKLVVSSTNNTGKQPENRMQYGGNLAIVSNAPQIDFIDTNYNDWSIQVNYNKMYFVREPWNYQDLVLDGRGNVGIGTDNPEAKLEVKGDLRISNGTNWVKMYIDDVGNHRQNLIFEIKDHIRGTGMMRWDGDSNWDSVSDLSLKTDIENEGNILSRLMQLDVKNYRWKDNPEAKIKKIGFIAQDIRPLFPSLVGEFKDKDADESTLTLKYAEFGVLAVGGLKELKLEKDAEIANLKTEMNTQIAKLKTEMEAEINALKTQIQQLLRNKE
ncbi:MAG: LamG-like jellyroll fold domain-containing protein [Microcoleaceae cyanobacterium]